MFYKFNQDTLEFQRVKPSTYVKGGLLILVVATIVGFSSSPRAVLKDLTPEDHQLVLDYGLQNLQRGPNGDDKIDGRLVLVCGTVQYLAGWFKVS